MKRISTLLVLSALFAGKANAQFSENFESQTAASLSTSCWSFNNAWFYTSPYTSVGARPNGSNAGQVSTPYLTPTNSSISISFSAQLSGALNGPQNRIVQISYGAYSVGTISYNSGSATTQATYNYIINITGISQSERLTFSVNGSGTSVDVLFDNIVVTGVNSTSACGQSSLAPLPIKLLSFSGNLHNNKAQLKWSVDENETGDHFLIEKSVDGKNFSEAGVVFVTPKAGTENYSYNETSEITSAGYFRLKIVNKNNSVSYSRIIALRAVKANGNRLSIMQNPVLSTLAINYTVNNTGLSEINLYNAAGVKVFTTKHQSQKGINAASFNLDNHVTPGTYVLEVINGTERNLAKMIKL